MIIIRLNILTKERIKNDYDKDDGEISIKPSVNSELYNSQNFKGTNINGTKTKNTIESRGKRKKRRWKKEVDKQLSIISFTNIIKNKQKDYNINDDQLPEKISVQNEV